MAPPSLTTRRQRRGFSLVELTIVIAIIGILASILFPVFAQARETARKSTCQSTFLQLGLALHLYARDHDGHFPPADHDLRPLFPEYLPERTAFFCEADDFTRSLPQPGDTGAAPLYTSAQYRGGLSSDDGPDIPIAAEWDFRHSSGATLLFLSGSTKWLSSTNWQPVTRGPRPLPSGVSSPGNVTATPFITPAAPKGTKGGKK